MRGGGKLEEEREGSKESKKRRKKIDSYNWKARYRSHQTF